MKIEATEIDSWALANAARYMVWKPQTKQKSADKLLLMAVSYYTVSRSFCYESSVCEVSVCMKVHRTPTLITTAMEGK
jgi:hypothetical protein